MPLAYSDVRDAYKTAQSAMPVFAQMSLPEYSEYMNRTTGSNDFDAGKGGESLIKNASAGLNKAIDWTGAPGALRAIGQGGASALGFSPESQQTVGDVAAGLPRNVINFAPAAIGTALTPFTGGVSTAAGLAATGALTGADVYEKTGSGAQALAQGGLAAALPGIGSKLGGAISRPILNSITGEAVTNAAGDVFRRSLGGLGAKVIEKGVEFGAENAAMISAQKALDMGIDVVHGENPFSEFSKQKLLADLASVAAFAPVAAVHGVIGHEGARSGVDAWRQQQNSAAIGLPVGSPELGARVGQEFDAARGTGIFSNQPLSQSPAVGVTGRAQTLMGEPLALPYTPPEERGVGGTPPVNDITEVTNKPTVITPEPLKQLTYPGFDNPDGMIRLHDASQALLSRAQGEISDATTAGIPVRPELQAAVHSPVLSDTPEAAMHKVADLASAMPHTPEAVRALGEVAKSNPAVAADPQVAAFNDKGIGEQVTAKMKEGTDAPKAVQEVVRGTAEAVKQKLENPAAPVVDLAKGKTAKEPALPKNATSEQRAAVGTPVEGTFANTLRYSKQKIQDFLMRTGKFTTEADAAAHADAIERVGLSIPEIADSIHAMGTFKGKALPDVLGATIARLDPANQRLLMLRLNKMQGEKATAFMLKTIMGHEVFDLARMGAERGELPSEKAILISNQRELLNGLDRSERVDLLNAVRQDILPREEASAADNEAIDQHFEYAAQDPDQTASTLFGLLNKAKDPTAVHNELVYLPKAIQQAATFLLQRTRDLIQGVKAYFGFEPKYQGLIDKLQNDYQKLSRTPDEITEAQKILTKMQNLDPEYFANRVMEQAPETLDTSAEWLANLVDGKTDVDFAKKKAIPEGVSDERGKKRGAIERTFMGARQAVWNHPEFQTAIDIKFTADRLSNMVAQKVQDGFVDRDAAGHVKSDPTKWMKPFFEDKKLNDTMRGILLKQSDSHAWMTPDEIGATMDAAGHSASDKAAGIRLVSAFKTASQQAGQSMFDNVRDAASQPLAAKLMREGGMETNDAYDLANRLVGATYNQDLPTIQGISQEMQQRGLSPQLMQDSASIADALQPVLKKADEGLRQRVGFVSEQRQGAHMVTFDKDGVSGALGFHSEQEAIDYAARKAKEAGVENVSLHDTAALNPGFEGRPVDENAVALVQQLLADKEKALAGLIDPAVLDALREQNGEFVKDLSAEIADRQANRLTKTQEKKPGREELDVVSSHLNYVNSVPAFVSRQLVQRRRALLQFDPELSKNPEMLKAVGQALDQALTPETPASKRIQNIAFGVSLWGNASSLVVHAFDSAQKVPVTLTRLGGGLSEGYGLLRKGFAAGLRDKLPDSLKSLIPGKTEPEVKAMFDYFEQSGALRHGAFDSALSRPDYNYLNSARMAKGLPAWRAPLEAAKTPLAYLNNMGKAMFAASEAVNNRAALYAGYKLSKRMNPGASEQEHYNAAQRVYQTTQSGGGAFNRPELIAKHVPFGGAPLTLGNYSVNTIGMTASMLQEAFKSLPHGTPEQLATRSAARKASVQLLTSMVATAGVMGLPGVSVAIPLLDKLFPDLEIHGNMRQWLSNLAGDDKQMGGVFADVAMKGLPTAFSNVDIHKRIGVGGILGFNEHSGFDVNNVFGPIGGYASNWAHAIGLASQGEYGPAALAASPTSIKNLVSTLRDGGMATDSKGNALTPLTGAEQMLRAMGFKPKVIADAAEEKELLRTSNAAHARDQAQFIQQQVQLLKDSPGNANQVMANVQKRTASDPNTDPQRLLIDIAQARMARDIPADMQRSAGQSGDLARTFPTPRGQITEAQRQDLLNQHRQELGLNPVNSQKPAQLDQLSASNPGASHLELLRQLARARSAGVLAE